MRSSPSRTEVSQESAVHASDGVISPTGLAREALVRGYKVIALTDHVGLGNLEQVVKTLVKECESISASWDILALPGVEITYVPLGDIPEAARIARELGARIVVVHGETIVEPVEPGTNLAAVQCPDVDILAHPGLLSDAEAMIAAERGVFVELSAKKGHSLTNGHVAATALRAGAKLLLDSDSHDVPDLLTPDQARRITLGAGLDEDAASQVLQLNPEELLRRRKTR